MSAEFWRALSSFYRDYRTLHTLKWWPLTIRCFCTQILQISTEDLIKFCLVFLKIKIPLRTTPWSIVPRRLAMFPLWIATLILCRSSLATGGFKEAIGKLFGEEFHLRPPGTHGSNSKKHKASNTRWDWRISVFSILGRSDEGGSRVARTQAFIEMYVGYGVHLGRIYWVLRVLPVSTLINEASICFVL